MDQPLLLYGDSYRFPDIYHLTRFLAPDPFITLEHGGEIVLLTNVGGVADKQEGSEIAAAKELSDPIDKCQLQGDPRDASSATRDRAAVRGCARCSK